MLLQKYHSYDLAIRSAGWQWSIQLINRCLFTGADNLWILRAWAIGITGYRNRLRSYILGDLFPGNMLVIDAHVFLKGIPELSAENTPTHRIACRYLPFLRSRDE